MAQNKQTIDRNELLADIAEMYYMEGHTQAEISKKVGMTRSAISRLLTEARQKGIVEIQIHRPMSFDSGLEAALIKQFGLIGARVVTACRADSYEELQIKLGSAAANELKTQLRPKMVIGVAWGTTIKFVIDAYDGGPLPGMRVVQLLGVLGSTRHSYSGQSLVEDLARKLGGEGIYLYTPFIVDTEDTADTLKNDPSIKAAISLARKSDLAVLGIGSTRPEYCSLLQGGHISRKDLDKIIKQGAVGDVNGHYFDIQGRSSDVDFHRRLMGLSKEYLLKVPVRLGTAGSPEKAEAIVGALRGGFINYLTTDSATAVKVLDLAAETEGS